MYPRILNIEICDDFEKIFEIRDEGNIAAIFPRSEAQKDAKSAQISIIKNSGIHSYTNVLILFERPFMRRKDMLQKHPFFSRPLIFFGTQQETESEEALHDSEAANVFSPWTGSFNHTPNNTGLFFLWDEDTHEDDFPI